MCRDKIKRRVTQAELSLTKRIRYACLLAVFGSLGSPRLIFAEEANNSDAHASVVQIDEFDGKFDLDWEIETENKSDYSLDKNPGELTITTAAGAIHGQQEDGAPLPPNTFLLKNPIEDGVDFEMTLSVNQFEPTSHWNQVDLIIVQSPNSYVKFCAEKLREADGPSLSFFTETLGKPTKHVGDPLEIDGPLWLRIKRTANTYTASYSNDAEQFIEKGAAEWTRDDASAPLRVGLVAYNGPNPDATAVTVMIESFEIKTSPGKLATASE